MSGAEKGSCSAAVLSRLKAPLRDRALTNFKLKKGDLVTAVVKATEVMIQKD
jgi:molybdopterin-binding protein